MEDPPIPLSYYICPIILIIVLIIAIFVIIHFWRNVDRKRWWTQRNAYSKWVYEDHTLKEARDIIEKLIDQKDYKEVLRFLEVLMRDRSLSPGTFSWYFFYYTYAMAKYNQNFGKRGMGRKAKEAIIILEDLQYDPFVMSDPQALMNINEQLEVAKAQKELMKRLKETNKKIQYERRHTVPITVNV